MCPHRCSVHFGCLGKPQRVQGPHHRELHLFPIKKGSFQMKFPSKKKQHRSNSLFSFFFFSSWVCLWLIAGGSFSVPPPRHSLPQHTHALLQQQSSSSRLRKLNLISANHSSPAHLGSHLSLSSDFNNDTVPPQKEEDRAQIKRSCLAGSSITFFCPLIIFYIFFVVVVVTLAFFIEHLG